MTLTLLFLALNLLTNGDFEKPGAGTPLANWQTAATAGGAVTQDTAVKKDGTASLKLAATQKGNARAQSEAFPVKAGHYYLVSFSYRAEGFGDKGWVGADDSARLFFYDDKNAQIIPKLGALSAAGYPWVIGLPYVNVPEWKPAAAIFQAPDGAAKATFQIALNNTNEALSPIAWVDNIAIREYTPPTTRGKAVVYKPKAPLTLYNAEYVDGLAVATKDKQKAGTMVSGPYAKDLPCGLYAVTFRVKAADNTIATPILSLTVHGDGILGNCFASLQVKGTDFKAPDAMQDFTVYAFMPPTGYLAVPVLWSGETMVSLESVTVTEIQTLSAEGWEKFLKP
jgi:hypothetical protein